MLKLIAKFLKVLNSEAEPGQISIALCLGMVAGLTPLMSMHNLLVLFMALALRVNLSAFVLSVGFFSGVAFALDPAFHGIGLAVLSASGLEGIFTTMYNNVFFRLARFNNSIVMGSLLVSLVAFIPVALLSNTLIRKYREHVLAWVMKSRLMQMFTGSKLYGMYQSVSGWGRD